MRRRPIAWALTLVAAAVLLSGCAVRREPAPSSPLGPADFSQTALAVEYPDVAPSDPFQVGGVADPRTIRDHAKLQYADITLEDAIRLSLEHSKVLVDLGGTVIRFPDSVRSTFGPAVQETDPQFGVEGALSAFDANFATSLFAEKNDRRYNNRFVGNLGFFDQDFDTFNAEITKRAVTGSLFGVRQVIDFDRNNNLGNQFPRGAWDTYLEGEVRHPLLRGGGVEYNRIAGTANQDGVYNGVLIARVRTDISLADFQMGVRDLVSNVENAYWDLYFAYRDLDTKIRARDTALETWRRVEALYRTGRRGGEAEKEAQAREQFFRFESEVQNALSGRPLEGTRTNNGTSPGTFRAVPGVYLAERRLRLMMGLPPNDEVLFRPADEPPVAPVNFEWTTIVDEALSVREELRRQRWEVKRRELELIASKNRLLPSLDFVGRYRWRGFGEKLIDAEREGQPPFDNAFMDLTGGKFQEWQMGMELSMPIGFRQAHSAVRNAELRMAQATAILREQELQIAHDLSTAVSELDRAYTVLETEISRVIATKQQLDALQAAYDADKVEFFVVLDAQRRLADAESRYHQARVEYVVALRNVHYEKGSLLAYCGVILNEGPWPLKAYADAAQLERRRLGHLRTDYRLDRPSLVSGGYEPQPDGSMPVASAAEEIPVPLAPALPPPEQEGATPPLATPPIVTQQLPSTEGGVVSADVSSDNGEVWAAALRADPPASRLQARPIVLTVSTHQLPENAAPAIAPTARPVPLTLTQPPAAIMGERLVPAVPSAPDDPKRPLLRQPASAIMADRVPVEMH